MATPLTRAHVHGTRHIDRRRKPSGTTRTFSFIITRQSDNLGNTTVIPPHDFSKHSKGINKTRMEDRPDVLRERELNLEADCEPTQVLKFSDPNRAASAQRVLLRIFFIFSWGASALTLGKQVKNSELIRRHM